MALPIKTGIKNDLKGSAPSSPHPVEADRDSVLCWCSLQLNPNIFILFSHRSSGHFWILMSNSLAFLSVNLICSIMLGSWHNFEVFDLRPVQGSKPTQDFMHFLYPTLKAQNLTIKWNVDTQKQFCILKQWFYWFSLVGLSIKSKNIVLKLFLEQICCCKIQQMRFFKSSLHSFVCLLLNAPYDLSARVSNSVTKIKKLGPSHETISV